jgi:hypothetical protein
VENYPGLHIMTGLAVVAAMRARATHCCGVFKDDAVELGEIVIAENANHERSHLP